MTYIQRFEYRFKELIRKFWAYKRGKLLTILVFFIVLSLFSSFLALDVPDYRKNIFNDLTALSGMAVVFFVGIIFGDALK